MRRRRGYIEVEVGELLQEVEDVDLIAECEDRGISLELPDGTELIREAYRELQLGHAQEAISILDRLINPKWSSKDGCRTAYNLFRKIA